MLDDINEQNDQMQQIQDAMAQPIGPAADMDEDELLGELEVRGMACCPISSLWLIFTATRGELQWHVKLQCPKLYLSALLRRAWVNW